MPADLHFHDEMVSAPMFYERRVILETGEPATLYVARWANKWVANLYAHDQKFLNVEQRRLPHLAAVFDCPDAGVFLRHVRLVYDLTQDVTFEFSDPLPA